MNTLQAQDLFLKLADINAKLEKLHEINGGFQTRGLMEAYIQIGSLRIPVSREVAMRHADCFAFDLEKQRDAIKQQLNITDPDPVIL